MVSLETLPYFVKTQKQWPRKIRTLLVKYLPLAAKLPAVKVLGLKKVWCLAGVETNADGSGSTLIGSILPGRSKPPSQCTFAM